MNICTFQRVQEFLCFFLFHQDYVVFAFKVYLTLEGYGLLERVSNWLQYTSRSLFDIDAGSIIYLS